MDNRGISFSDTISSSQSSYRYSNASIAEEDDASSQFGSSHDSSEDDRISNAEGDNDDLDEKIRWFFLRIEQTEEPTEIENPSLNEKILDQNLNNSISSELNIQTSPLSSAQET